MSSSNTLDKSLSRSKLSQPSVILALFSVYIVWGATDLGNQIAVESYPPFMLIGMRLLLATVILIGFLKIRGTDFPPIRLMLNATVIGALMFGGRAGFLAFARLNGVGTGILMLGIATVPLWAMMFSFIFGYRPNRLELLGLVVGIIGMSILNIGNDMQFQLIGVIVLLFSPMIWAFGSMYKNEITMPDGLMGTGFQMVGGCITLFIMSLLRGEQIPVAPSVESTIAFLFLSVLGTLVAFTAYMHLVEVVSPGLATSYAYVNPVVEVFFGAILFGDVIEPKVWIALIVIGLSVILIMTGKSRIGDNEHTSEG